MNTFGRLLRLTTFGESHGIAIGGILDGFPSGITIDFEEINRALIRRRPGLSELTTSRQEEDQVEWLSGLFEGKSTGTPIAFIIRNTNHQSKDYDNLAHCFRPGHADYTYTTKYGIRDYRGGGRSSARETAIRVVAGALASQLLIPYGIKIWGYTSGIGSLSLTYHLPTTTELNYSRNNSLRCLNPSIEAEVTKLIQEVKEEKDSLGGTISVLVEGVPTGWGEPLYDKLSARLAYAMMSIGGVKGIEFGDGFHLVEKKGSEANDTMYIDEEGKRRFSSNHSGGISGGISTGQPIQFRLAIKPTSSIGKAQQTITKDGVEHILEIKGRHDPCIIPRAVSVVEAMTALVLADFMLLDHQYCSVDL